MAASRWHSTLYAADLYVEACGAIIFDTAASAPAPASSPGGGRNGVSSSSSSSSTSSSTTTTTTSNTTAAASAKVCLVYYAPEDEWLLPKGRRNCGESRQEAAVREAREETGYACRLRPVSMPVRAPSPREAADVRDVARRYDGLTEPFMLDVRELGGGGGEAREGTGTTGGAGGEVGGQVPGRESRGAGGTKLVWWYVAEVEGRVGEAEEHFKPQFFGLEDAVARLTFQNDRTVLRKAIDVLAQQSSSLPYTNGHAH